VYRQVKRAHGTVPSANKGRKIRDEPRHTVPEGGDPRRDGDGAVALLGAIGCVTRPEAIMSAPGDVVRTTAPPIDPAENTCAQFSCQP